jgi:hypothetical protein
MPTFSYTVDGEPEQTDQHELTPDQILTSAGLDTSTHYLVEIKGAVKESFEGKGGIELHMHDHMVFVSVFTGPTPVS